MGKALVSTTLACEGIDVRHGEHLLVADDPSAFAQAVAELLADRDLAGRLGAAGREQVIREYTWQRSSARLENLYQRVLSYRAPDREARNRHRAARQTVSFSSGTGHYCITCMSEVR